MKKLTAAIAYDFDGTLAPGNMQEHAFIPKVGITNEAFWTEVRDLAGKKQADQILVYMKLMLEKARSAEIQVTRTDIANFGKNMRFFDGVESWFDRIDNYGKEKNIDIEHYIISSGNKEIIEGTSIGRRFRAVFASSFMYDQHGVACWPALAVNYTNKTQYLFRINKGCLDVTDDEHVNGYLPDSDRSIPFNKMIFIGDGATDVPCMRVVNTKGGHSIAVYKPNTPGAKAKAEGLMTDGRSNFLVPADYRADKDLDNVVKGIIDKIAADHSLRCLEKRPLAKSKSLTHRPASRNTPKVPKSQPPLPSSPPVSF